MLETGSSGLWVGRTATFAHGYDHFSALVRYSSFAVRHHLVPAVIRAYGERLDVDLLMAPSVFMLKDTRTYLLAHM